MVSHFKQPLCWIKFNKTMTEYPAFHLYDGTKKKKALHNIIRE